MISRNLFAGAFVSALSLVSATAISTEPAKAAVLYDNLSAAVTGIDFIGPPSPTALGPLYDSFSTLGSSFTITQLQLLVGLLTQPPVGGFGVALYNDSGTSTPGSLNQFIGTVLDSAVSSSGQGGVVTFNSLAITLAPATRYWIGLSSTNTDAGWIWSSDISGPGVAGEFYSNANDTFTNDSGPYQMRISGDEVVTPLPATLPLFATGLGAFGFLGWRRKRKQAALVLACIFATVITPASASSLLINPGFETGDLTGWTVGGTSPSFGVASALPFLHTPIPGAALRLSSMGADHTLPMPVVAQGTLPPEYITLSQTIVVAPSSTYSIGYIAKLGLTDRPGETFGFGNFLGVDILINGASIHPSYPTSITSVSATLDLPTIVNGTFTTDVGQESLTVTYSASASGISIGLTLDDFFEGPAPAAAATSPLPAALPLFATGLGALGLLGWRRKRKQAA